MDIVDKAKRSSMMANIKGRNTKPEITLRKLLHAKGFRFSLHQRNLPGSPDIVLRKYKTCIFVHGCFWHQHPNCKYSVLPKTRPEFWADKFKKNVERDYKHYKSLADLGWQALTVWECELRLEKYDVDLLIKKITSYSDR